MKKTKHWLHIILIILTAGFWLPVYVICLVMNQQWNKAYFLGCNSVNRELSLGYRCMYVTLPQDHNPDCQCPRCLYELQQ